MLTDQVQLFSMRRQIWGNSPWQKAEVMMSVKVKIFPYGGERSSLAFSADKPLATGYRKSQTLFWCNYFFTGSGGGKIC